MRHCDDFQPFYAIMRHFVARKLLDGLFKFFRIFYILSK